MLICSSLVIFASTTNTPAPVISGYAGCSLADRNSCAYFSEQDFISNGTGLRLMTKFLGERYQRSVLNLSPEIFIQEKKSKKFDRCQFLRESSDWYFLTSQRNRS